MKKIRECPKCSGYFEDEEFCSECGSKIIERDPMIDILVEVERNEYEAHPTRISSSLTIEELFEIAKKQGLIKR